MNSSGTIVMEYTYDAWGYIRNTTGSLKDTLGKANALRYRGYVYDTETALYYLQSRYYNPGTGRFINADALVITGQGLLGNNMFAYCLNNPIRYTDTLGTVAEEATDSSEEDEDKRGHRLVGAGVQINIDAGAATMGVEIILYWDPTVCGEGNWIIAVYTYGGVATSCNDAFIGAAATIITDNASLLMADSENNVSTIMLAIAASLGNGFSFSISAVGIVGNEDFVSVNSYEQSFTAINAGLGRFQGGVAYSDTGFAVSFGGALVGTPKLPASWGISKTYYKLEKEIVIPQLIGN